MAPYMTVEAEFTAKYGPVIEMLVTQWRARSEFDVQSPGYVLVFLDWTTRHQLEAIIGIAVHGDGFEIGSFLSGRNVQSGRNWSWDTPPSKLQFRLQEIKDHLEKLRTTSAGEKSFGLGSVTLGH